MVEFMVQYSIDEQCEAPLVAARCTGGLASMLVRRLDLPRDLRTIGYLRMAPGLVES